MAPSGSGDKGKRSRTGCGTCRARKVKCDERPNGCANCARLQIPCLRPVPSRSASASDAQEQAANAEKFRRHRTFRSCNSCRTAKVRCSGERPCCQRCSRRGDNCEYDGKGAPRWINRASNWQGGSDTNHQRNATPDSFEYSSDDASVEEETPNDFRNGTMETGNQNSSQHLTGISPGSNESKGIGEVSDSLSWLFASPLPSYSRTLRLVKTYFRLIHPLRCFGFIHRPSWMQCFEDQSQKNRNNNSLLLMMCALGAKFYAAATPKSQPRGAAYALRAGTQWAQRAKQLLFMSLNSPTPETIMTAILLHEHELRIGNYSSAFMITGLAVRLVQGLQLNVEPMSVQPRPDSTMAPATFLESCRRIMWSVYIMDSWVGSGVDELTMINEKNIRIRLPSDESDFTLETTKTTLPPMLSSDEQSIAQRAELDVAAHFVLLLGLRKKVLRLVKHLDDSQPPWAQDSEFSLVCHSLTHWAECLPKSLQFDRSAIQKRKISNQHGALMLLHLTYHQTMCDLTRIGMPELFRIRVPFQFPPEKADFVERVQNACFDNCIAVTNVFREALHHGLEGFADTWLCVVAHDSLRVVVHYLSKRLGTLARHDNGTVRDMAVEGVGVNVRVLEKLIPLQALAKPLHASSLAIVKAAGIQLPSTLPGTADGPDLSNEEPGPRAPSPAPHTPEYVLNPLAIYRMARQDIRQHEKQPSTPNDDIPQESELTSPPHHPPVPALPPELDTLHETSTHEPQTEMSYYNGPILDAFDLPLSFDGLQAYMSLPPLLNQYDDMALGRTDGNTGFAFGDSTQTSSFGASNYDTGVGETTDMQYGGPHGQVWMG